MHCVRWQHVVRSRHVIADDFRRVRAEEDRTGIADAGGERVRVTRRDLEMLGRDAVSERRRFVQRAQHDDGAEVAPALAGDGAAGKRRELARHGLGHLCAKGCIVRHEDRLCGRVVLGLGEKVRGDPFGIVFGIRDHQNFGGPRDGIDAHCAEHLSLGSSDEGLPGPTIFATGAIVCVP